MPIAQSSSKNQADTNKSMKTQQQKKAETEPEQKQEQTSSGVKTPPEQPEFIKQTLIIIEKKVRNLDKRRQKLEEYKESQRKGQKLNEDQLLAVSRYDEVIRTLELSKELEKQFVTLANDSMKQQKKQAKRDQMERDEQFKEKLKETHRYFSVLDRFGDETVRNDFLTESNGAFKLTQEELESLDEFNKLVAPCSLDAKLEAASVEFAEHLSALIEGKNKPIPALPNSVTYSELKKLFDRVLSAPYWTEEPKKEVGVAEVEDVKSETPVESTETTETLTQAVENLQLNGQEMNTQQNEQASFRNQTVDDYVIVSSSDCAESLCQSKSPSLQPQQHTEQLIEQHTEQLTEQLTEQQIDQQNEMTQSQTKTFFTTLNQPSEQRNINEFINSCENNGEGLNFFQDSELASRKQHEQMQQQQNEMNFQNQQSQPQENFNQLPNDMQKDQQFRQRGYREQNGNRPFHARGGQQGDRRNGDRRTEPRNNDNRGPRNNGYRGGANSGPRDGNSQRGGYRGDGGYRGGQNGGQRNNGPRGNYQQQRGNQNQDMNEQHA